MGRRRADSSEQDPLILSLKHVINEEHDLDTWGELVQSIDQKISSTFRQSEEWQEVFKLIGDKTKQPLKSKHSSEIKELIKQNIDNLGPDLVKLSDNLCRSGAPTRQKVKKTHKKLWDQEKTDQ